MFPTSRQQTDVDIVEKSKSGGSDMEQQVKSRAVVKYSAVQVPSNFARLQCNTDLNLPPSNWLTSSAESYGLQHVLPKSTGFSSFRMAHMFPDCMGEVDVVSDAENIKKLLKIPYSRDAVSMMVHCIEKTLLIDEFDIHKHLLRTSESDWEWLRKFFFEQVLQTLSEKDVGVSTKHKSRQALQQRALVSKFLHYSLAEPEKNSQPAPDQSTDIDKEEDILAKNWPPLPEPRLEEELPDPATDHTFNRNVVWTFEDIQMLLGTDLPIFGGSTHPCISLRLRDMAKPISVLTGIDYWLDNLMCNVPEVVMCYHLDGIVQRYELVKTEDLPQMPDSKFSPNLIRDVAQNILSFLKSNATKSGHTYWLFKGKDEDVVKLYDLTSLCSEGLLEKGQNPFTVPVAMLLYRVARNMKNCGDPSSLQPGTIRALLKNCLFLLPKEKYPQIVTSAHYMLSDLYLPLGVEPEYLQDESVSPEPLPEDEEAEHKTSPIKSLCISDDFQPPPLPQYVPPPPLVGTVKERCQQALEHVVAGLQCLPFFEIAPSPDVKNKKTSQQSESNVQSEPKMAQPNQPIPMPYSSLSPEKPKESETGTEKATVNKKKNKKKKQESKHKAEKMNKNKDLNEEDSILDQYPVYFWNSDRRALLSKPQAMTLPTWQTPETMDNASWKGHLRTLLYEKACLIYNTLAEAEYSNKRFGKSLRYVRMVLQCHAHMARGCGKCTSLVSGMLGRAGDNCFHLTQDWTDVDTHRLDYDDYTDTDKVLQMEMSKDMPNNDYPYECLIIPEALETVEQMLLSSCSCYQQALMLRPSDALRCRIGNVHNELSVIYMNKITKMDMKKSDEATTKAQLEALFTLAQHHLDLGQAEFAKIDHSYNLALLLSNAGRLMRMQAHYRCNEEKPGLQQSERAYYDKAIHLYRKGLGVLSNRKSGPQVWDVIMWELSTTLYTMATLYQDNPPAVSDKSQEEVERELIELLTKALQSCDLETKDFRQYMYQYRAAILHYRLGSLYQHMYRTKPLDDSKRKNVLHLVNFHYDKSALIMKGLDHPLEFLRLQMERVALQEFIAENSSPNGKIKVLQNALDYLISCRPVLESIVERCKTEELQAAKRDSSVIEEVKTDETIPLQEEERLLVLFESRIQFVLKSLVKLSLSSSNPKMSNLATKFKEMYSLVLKQKTGLSLAAHLSSAVAAVEQLR